MNCGVCRSVQRQQFKPVPMDTESTVLYCPEQVRWGRRGRSLFRWTGVRCVAQLKACSLTLSVHNSDTLRPCVVWQPRADCRAVWAARRAKGVRQGGDQGAAERPRRVVRRVRRPVVQRPMRRVRYQEPGDAPRRYTLRYSQITLFGRAQTGMTLGTVYDCPLRGSRADMLWSLRSLTRAPVQVLCAATRRGSTRRCWGQYNNDHASGTAFVTHDCVRPVISRSMSARPQLPRERSRGRSVTAPRQRVPFTALQLACAAVDWRWRAMSPSRDSTPARVRLYLSSVGPLCSTCARVR